MATVKRITDLTGYTSVLPYASELFGVYQPLLGWKSKRMQDRFDNGFGNDQAALLDALKNGFTGLVDIVYKSPTQVEINMKPGVLENSKMRSFDSILLQQVAQRLPAYKDTKPISWNTIITKSFIDALLGKDVAQAYATAYTGIFNTASPAAALPDAALAATQNTAQAKRIQRGAFERQLQYESAIAGALLFLVKKHKYAILEEIFYNTKNNTERALQLVKTLSSKNSVEAFFDISHLNPRDQQDIKNVALSPISVVHLFRQYFFELDSFLGTPVGHVWLSPGSSVELLEVHTRTSRIEKTLENTLDTFTSAEKTTTTQDEISEAVKSDNQRDIKFGASVTASYASIDATASFDYAQSQKSAREVTHKRMRQQTEKLSSEIRKNFKSTFKTLSEITDVSSTKHIMANTTANLVNYELRRKMRQVGVQVQDIGTFLCWQSYVDDPGKELGLGKLIHVAQSPELGGLPHPEEIPALQAFQEEKITSIPFISVEGTNADSKDEVYQDGVEVDDSEWGGTLEKIQPDFVLEFVCPKSDYQLSNVEFDTQGQPISVSRKTPITNTGNKASFTLHLDMADFQGQRSAQIKLVLHWSPLGAANEAIAQKNKENIANFKEQEKAAYEKAFIENVKERVTMASRITTRNGDELREEERIAVYRKLVQEMLLNGVTLPDDQTRHIVSELLNSIFDIDKMLYFVAPEWWRPRHHRSKQQLGETTTTPIFDPSAIVAGSAAAVMEKGLKNRMFTASTLLKPDPVGNNTVGWGGINESNRDNYYITENSEPAKLGSSLGWLLQLDGDNMRNAFLNAPWVKAVLPIRPGKEEAAINWLKGVEGLNGIDDEVIYHATNPNEKDIDGNPLEGQKMIDVLLDLAKKIKKKYDEGIETGTFPKQDEVSDPALVDNESTVTATPIDRVYEHGFFPLNGSFRANVDKNYQIFDQWIEILPTDQVVPVEVRYDSKTGRQIQ
jgi:hypothetical protein